MFLHTSAYILQLEPIEIVIPWPDGQLSINQKSVEKLN